ncbi:hypothetical protein HaLaN_17583 [Haematococcus lacustris]|uniref:Uncharacterized protein n=1 Tax=Haematococcus lacustris TaxID=44745 RepID=A0A699ZLJ7_HAELA|nr:hypothetical protein HaLaN_17583 [Haematococcus lacustris]
MAELNCPRSTLGFTGQARVSLHQKQLRLQLPQALVTCVCLA